ncbi:FAS-associated factor 1 [Ctenocephalides felis]|uniref:FAS-associated factor 1 n=1 Tax=Ctenocephalides felis TaxID=7515 RepID=UPI000E6E52BE|nr:FAS-associated factor 1 [Ctenocephalides felis]
MAENREEVLANFQSIAAIDDVAEAILILDNCDWDLLAAINQVMPVEEDAGFNHLNRPQNVDVVANTPEAILPVVNNFENAERLNNDIAGSSSSNSKPWQPRKTLRFHIQHKNNLIEVEISDSNTVGQLKSQLHPKVGIPPCQMILKNWPDGLKPLDETVLSTLNLPQENILMLTDMQTFATDDSEATNRLTQIYGLEIRNLDSDVCYNLNFPGTKTILEIKNDMYTLTDIPARHQCWTGWPKMSDLDSMMLCMIGLDSPTHKLTVKKTQAPSSNSKNNKGTSTASNSNYNSADLSQDSDNSSTAGDEFYEDASESFNIEEDTFIDQMSSRRSQPLIPEDVDDETIGSLHFSERYANRYGPRHPTFFAGSLEDAMKEACQKSAKDRKLLGVYLHHDKSVLSNVFCTQLLGFESVIDALSRHFVVYGWDFTNPNNRNLFLSSLSGCLNSQAAMQVRNIAVERLPAFVIIMRTRSITEIYTIVNGNVGVNELMTSILEAVDIFTEGVRSEIREEEERAARERVKYEQDEAYRESLEADRAKERERAQREREERRERERLEAEREKALREREERKEKVKKQLPPEPEDGGSGDGITKIRIRLPTGSFAERRFLITTELKVLLDYMIVLGYPSEDYKFISSWPRKDLTTIDPVSTLQELKLYPQETVIIEER